VDRAEGIWVDAGDSVSCAFTHTFAGGTHQARVDVGDVNPGDWDPANNSAVTSIAIVSDEEAFVGGSAWAGSSVEHYRSHNT
jgi:hypothetical protein